MKQSTERIQSGSLGLPPKKETRTSSPALLSPCDSPRTADSVPPRPDIMGTRIAIRIV